MRFCVCSSELGDRVLESFGQPRFRLGLPRGQMLRLVVIPQAIRVIVPPLTSEYLNLIKNSSLAVAIGFADYNAVGNTIINQTGQAIEGFTLIAAAYLLINIPTSLLMNLYNRYMALVER